eukprot:6834-Heterococcus_DN1.PRE.3
MLSQMLLPPAAQAPIAAVSRHHRKNKEREVSVPVESDKSLSQLKSVMANWAERHRKIVAKQRISSAVQQCNQQLISDATTGTALVFQCLASPPRLHGSVVAAVQCSVTVGLSSVRDVL